MDGEERKKGGRKDAQIAYAGFGNISLHAPHVLPESNVASRMAAFLNCTIYFTAEYHINIPLCRVIHRWILSLWLREEAGSVTRQ